MGVPTLVLARTDSEAANLLTNDFDPNDKPFLTGERTAEGFYRVKNGLEQAISRGVAYAPYADLVWCETGTPDLGFAREFAQAVLADNPNKLLAYNCSPSFNWKKNLDDSHSPSSRMNCRTWATSTNSSPSPVSTTCGSTCSISHMTMRAVRA